MINAQERVDVTRSLIDMRVDLLKRRAGWGACLLVWMMIGIGPALAQEVKQVRGTDIVESARWQVGKTVEYDPAYVALSYPNGDLPIARGVCTDVVIRALRRARKMDLQKLVHKDMKLHFSSYPKIWGLKSADKNIDHRRVPNLKVFFKRSGWALPVSKKKSDYLPGDIVTCTVAKRLPHIMVVSDRKDEDGTPMIIHNIGAGTREEAQLFAFPITGHYRIK